MKSEYFNISQYAYNKAFEELSKCFRIHSLPIKKVLEENNIQVLKFDFNGNSNFENLIAKKSLQEIKMSEINGSSAFRLSRVLFALRKKEIEYLINTVIFFQVMMESDINEVLGNTQGFFKDKWKSYLKKNNASDLEKKSFQLYDRNIYQELRIPVVHPEQNIGIRNISKFNIKHTHKNIKEGWFSFCFLLSKIKEIELNYERNWESVCEGHNIPSNIEKIRFRDIEEFATKLNEKYLVEFNNKGQ